MAKLKIYSDIVGEEEKLWLEWSGMEAVAFSDVDRFIESIPEDDERIELQINCRGGLVDVALAMYDALRASGKVISAEVLGECSSAATLLLLAARKDLRRAHPNATILIHNPYIAGFVEGDAKDVGRIADTLEDMQDRFLDIYVERTGSDRETLAALMDENRPMSAQKAKDLGFIEEIIQPISASNKQSKNDAEKMNLRKRIVNALAQALGVYGMTLETADGQQLELEKESGEPVVGDIVTSGDGEYIMPDGKVIEVEGGVITEIKLPEEEQPEEVDEVAEDNGDGEETGDGDNAETDSDKDAEIDRLKAIIADKDAEIDRLKRELEDAQANAKSDDDVKVLDMVSNAGGVQWLERVQSTGKANARKTEGNAAKATKKAQKGFAEYMAEKSSK